jgi:cytochrome c oxidase subunit 2
MQIKTHSLILLILSLSVITSCTNTNKPEDKTTTEAKPEVLKGDALKGKDLFTTCIACHGNNAQGMQVLNAPNLVAQDAWYLQRQLANFKARIRGAHADDIYGAQMAPMAQTLADEQAIVDVVAYIKTLSATANEQTIKGDIVKGEDYYNMACGSCHGTKAAGNESLNSPKLTGINDWYLQRQVLNFKKGIRGSHADDKFGAQMKQIAGTTEEGQMLNDIIAYIQSVEELQ